MDDPRRSLGEFRGAVAALNAHDSNTGMNFFRATIAPVAAHAEFFSSIAATGSHEASVSAVAEGRADLASIDCISFALLKHGNPKLIERVTVLAETSPSPSLPFIASASLDRSTIEAVRLALFAVLADPDLASARETLGLKGVRAATPADYDRVTEIAREAAEAGYPVLR